MSLLDRFAKGFRTNDLGADEPPGLAQQDDGTVVYIKPDGSRVEVGGGSTPLHGFAVHWFNSPGWTIPNDDSWRVDEHEFSGIDWDTDHYANPDSFPFFACTAIPDGLGGIYLTTLRASFSSAASGGYVGANADGSAPSAERMHGWTPCIYADDAQRLIVDYSDQLNVDEGINTFDLASILNVSGHDITVHRVDWIVTRIEPQPA